VLRFPCVSTHGRPLFSRLEPKPRQIFSSVHYVMCPWPRRQNSPDPCPRSFTAIGAALETSTEALPSSPRCGLTDARSLPRAHGPRRLQLRPGLPEGNGSPDPAPPHWRGHASQGSHGQYAFRPLPLRQGQQKPLSADKALNSRPPPTFPQGPNRAIAPATACLPAGLFQPFKRKVRSWRRSRLPIRSSNSTATR